MSAGEDVDIQVDFKTQDLPSDASYRIAYTVNGMTFDSPYITYGAGDTGTVGWYYHDGYVIATPGVNQVTVTVDPDESVPETSYADNTISFNFTASLPTVNYLTYSVSQIRAAYRIDDIPDFDGETPDGTGQTIGIVDAFNDPSIITDLDGFDEAMNMTTNTSPTLYQAYGPATSILTVFNQDGTNITNDIADSGEDGVPGFDDGSWQLEETLDVEWAHAIAPGAHIDLIECNSEDDLFTGATTAGQLPGVTVVSMSWIFGESDWSDGSAEAGYDANTFVTASGHPGVTFLASTGDGGTPGGYPAFSPNVVAVGATELTMNGDSYGSETAWSFPAPSTLDNGSGSYSQSGSWAPGSGGFSGTFSTAAGGSDSTAEWTTSITSSEEGWLGGVEVSATWVPGAGNATNATYQIYDGSPESGTLLDTVSVDQTVAPQGTADGNTQFQELGDYYPQSGTITVVLDAGSANGSVVADAVGIAPAWATAGGQSQYESEPAYQLPVQSTGFRTTPDVSFNGSSNSGVTCFENGRLNYDYYGTSLSSPCWAGLIAIVDQGRVEEGASVLDSAADPMQTLEALYSLPSSDFHEITTGYNGLFAAGPSYNELTGLGSPIANLLVPDLVSYDTAGTQLVITAEPPSSVTAGSEFGLTVSVENGSGDVLTNYSGDVTITLASNPGTGTLGGTFALPVTNGTASFSDLTLDTAGMGYTLRASSSGLASLVTSAFNVTPAAAYKLVLSTEPSSTATAGQAFSTQPVVEEEDQYGNIETTDDSTDVTVSLESGLGPLEGTAMVTLSAGVAVFSNLADNKAESITLLFQSGSLKAATSSGVDVSAAAPFQLVIETQPSSVATAGQAFLVQPVILEEDQYGNIETTDNYTVVTVSLSSGTGPLQGTASVTVSDGEASFANLADDKAETIKLVFESSGLTPATSGAIVVSPAAAYRLVIETKPSSAATAGQAFAIQPVIEEEDQYGNIETSDNSTVISVSLESGVGPLQGTNTATVSSGAASFSGLADNLAETITLIFKSGSLKSAISSSINVSAAAAFPVDHRNTTFDDGHGRAGILDSAGHRGRGSVRQPRDER